MAAFGTYAAGLAPFGLGAPLPASPAAKGSAGSRYINPTTKDYEQDPNGGQLKQMPGTRQRVLLAVITALRSASVSPTVGIKFPKKMGTYFEKECRLAVTSALRQMADVEKVIRIESITVERGRNSRARITVQWFDPSTGTSDKVDV